VLFQTLDSLNNEQSPAFSADEYASITAAELRLSAAILSISAAASNASFALPRAPRLWRQGGTGIENSTLTGHRIDLINDRLSLTLPENWQLDELWQCYSRALDRAYTQMKHHTAKYACMRSVELVGLLDAVHASALLLWGLHPINETAKEQLACFFYYVEAGTAVFHQLPLRDGSARFLEALLDMVADLTITTDPRLERSAIKALFAAWPLMIEPWLTGNAILLKATDGVESLDEDAVANRLLQDSEEPLRMLARLALRALSHEDTCGRLLQKVLECFQKRLAHEVDGDKFPAEELGSLVTIFARRATDLSPTVRQGLLAVLAAKHPGREAPTFLYVLATTDPVLALLNIIAVTPDVVQIVEVLLNDVLRLAFRLRGYQPFTRRNGMKLLVDIGQISDYRTCASCTIVQLCARSSMFNRTISEDAVPSWLAAISFVLQNPLPDPEIAEYAADFMDAVPRLLSPENATLTPETIIEARDVIQRLTDSRPYFTRLPDEDSVAELNDLKEDTPW
jgi:hypothetical protein